MTSLSRRDKATFSMFVIGAVILLLTAWLWWGKVSVDPHRVWNDMVRQSISTQGVTMHATQTSNGQTVDQYEQFQLGAGANLSHGITTLKQGTTTVHTETIGTTSTDYSRYTGIQTSQKGSNGKALDFSKVLNVWSQAPAGKSNQAAYLSQAVLGVSLPLGSIPVPIGNVGASQRSDLLQEITNDQVYDVNYSSVKKQRQNGRLVYVYSVKLQPVTYVRLMQNFAKAVGLHDLDAIDPNSYSGSQPFTVSVTVDAHAKQIVNVTYQGAHYQETYSSYDVPVTTPVPAGAISSDELQKRLGAL
ncbi:MAG TPA: hypothetical protein VHT70_04345 [Candidatus Saccharimonadales bacterium]|nr:hypothetical protein [Candidatus Saccharimonadales bacterium]